MLVTTELNSVLEKNFVRISQRLMTMLFNKIEQQTVTY